MACEQQGLAGVGKAHIQRKKVASNSRLRGGEHAGGRGKREGSGNACGARKKGYIISIDVAWRSRILANVESAREGKKGGKWEKKTGTQKFRTRTYYPCYARLSRKGAHRDNKIIQRGIEAKKNSRKKKKTQTKDTHQGEAWKKR